MMASLAQTLEHVEAQNRKVLGRLKRLSQCDVISPEVQPSAFHTVAVTLKQGQSETGEPSSVSYGEGPMDYISLPCSQKYYWGQVNKALSSPMLTCDDISTAVRCYRPTAGKFVTLDCVINELMTPKERTKFFGTTLPGMVRLCLSLPQVLTCDLPVLSRGKNHSITLSQHQIASLMANAFFSTFQKRVGDDTLLFPPINFQTLLAPTKVEDQRKPHRAQKLLCILRYFESVIDRMPEGLVTFTRRYIKKAEMPDWSASTKSLSPFLTLHEGSIENEGAGLLEVDFADMYIGGYVLSFGNVQEEIIFVTCPELIISRLFTQRIDPEEAFIMTGAQKYCKHRGYGRSFEFAGMYPDNAPLDSYGRRCRQIVAIDATNYSRKAGNLQYEPAQFTREVNKAFAGYANPCEDPNPVGIASGKWGCGVFRGDAHLKSILQLLAASEAGRPLVLFTFGDLRLQKELEEIYGVILKKTVGQVWNILHQFYSLHCKHKKPSITLHRFITTSKW